MDVIVQRNLNPTASLCALLEGLRSHGPLPEQPQIVFMASTVEAMQRRCPQQACQRYMTSLVEQLPDDGLQALQQVSLIRDDSVTVALLVPDKALAWGSKPVSKVVNAS